jgi:serine/threonine protein kinase
MKICPLCHTTFPNEHANCVHDGAILIGSRDLEPGLVVRSKYRVVRVLGRGGMGTVYLAEHILLGKQRALKFISSELSQDAKFLKRFRLEALAAIELRHPNIVEVVDLDQAEDGSPFIAMEYVEGMPLREALADAPFPVERALSIARGVGLGLIQAHNRKIIHRDIKPENILLARDAGGREIPKILDFGIAAMKESSTAVSRTRGLMLTPEYAAPEQWKGMAADEQDDRVDLYALGGVLHEMLTGRTSFHSHNTEGWMYQHLQTTPEVPSQARPELARWKGLDGLVLRLLEKDRDRRTASAEAFVRELDGVRSGTPVSPASLASGPGETVRPGTKTIATATRAAGLTSAPGQQSSAPHARKEETETQRRPRGPVASFFLAAGITLAIAAIVAGAWALLHRQSRSDDDASKLEGEIKAFQDGAKTCKEKAEDDKNAVDADRKKLTDHDLTARAIAYYSAAHGPASTVRKSSDEAKGKELREGLPKLSKDFEAIAERAGQLQQLSYAADFANNVKNKQDTPEGRQALKDLSWKLNESNDELRLQEKNLAERETVKDNLEKELQEYLKVNSQPSAAPTTGTPPPDNPASEPHAQLPPQTTPPSPVDHGNSQPASPSPKADSGTGNGSSQGIFVDRSSGLMWTAKDNGTDINYQKAVEYCASLRLGGYSDWQLPDIDELRGLFDTSGRKPPQCKDIQGFSQPYPVRIKREIDLSCYSVWSKVQGSSVSMTNGPAPTMKTFNFFNGGTGQEFKDKGWLIRGLCVRSGS